VCVSDGVQPGTKVDEDLWRQFRQEVKRRRGGTRGHVRNELEAALRAYIQAGDATPADIDARLQRIEAAVGAAPTDGGATAPEAQNTHTHRTDPDPVTERPNAKAPRDKKTRYLAHCVTNDLGNDFEQCPRSILVTIVRDEYGFRSDTAEGYVKELVDHFALVDHPEQDKFGDTRMLVTPDKEAEILERIAEDTLDEVA
jgi:hypothetical protein